MAMDGKHRPLLAVLMENQGRAGKHKRQQAWNRCHRLHNLPKGEKKEALLSSDPVVSD